MKPTLIRMPYLVYHQTREHRSLIRSHLEVEYKWEYPYTKFEVCLIYPNGSRVMIWDGARNCYRYVHLEECLVFHTEGFRLRPCGLPVSATQMGSPFRLRITAKTDSLTCSYLTSNFYVNSKQPIARPPRGLPKRIRGPMSYAYSTTPVPDLSRYVGMKRERPSVSSEPSPSSDEASDIDETMSESVSESLKSYMDTVTVEPKTKRRC